MNLLKICNWLFVLCFWLTLCLCIILMLIQDNYIKDSSATEFYLLGFYLMGTWTVLLGILLAGFHLLNLKSNTTNGESA